MRTILALLLALLLLPAAPDTARAADDFDGLMARVPASAYALVAVDHARLSEHPHYDKLLSFLESEGQGRGLRFAVEAGMTAGEDVVRSVSFERDAWTHGTLLAGDLDVDALKAHAKKTLAEGFETGEHAGKTWFSVDGTLRAAPLGDGVVVFAESKVMEEVLALAAGEGRPATKRDGFRALERAASKGKPTIWGFSWVPEAARKRLRERGSEEIAEVERTTIRARGTADMDLQMVGYTGDHDEAKAVVESIRGKIERKIMGSTLLKALGVAALAQRIDLEAEGKRAVAALKLTADQIGLLASVGPRVITILEQ
ncbi:MAG: hypothetical protein ACQEXJ_12550 [Myxococcota bacterium]